MVRKFVIFPNQLFECFLQSPKGCRFFVVEDPCFFGRGRGYSFSKQRWVYIRACVEGFVAEMKQNGHPVSLIEHNEADEWVSNELDESFEAYDPVDAVLTKKLKSRNVQVIDRTPMFLLSGQDLAAYEQSVHRVFFQTNFYKFVRESLGFLMVDGGYKGGKLSFDSDNRKPLDDKILIPDFQIEKDAQSKDLIKSATSYVERTFKDLKGPVNIVFPVTRKAAYEHFDKFLNERFKNFGPFQDSISKDELILFHAGISPMINIGLLNVRKVVEAACSAPKVPIASQEGFVRQIIGWREYIRYVYVRKGDELRHCNLLDSHKSIDSRFYTGFSIPVLDAAIKMCVEYGYAHHILRLMVLCNFMVLSQIHPSEIYRWFMELTHDAFDWVMIPNVYGMGYATDLIMTKPYISGSNYILKMSKDKRSDWCSLWDALFYAFLHRQKDRLGRNHRMGMMFANLRKKDNIEHLLKQAQAFIDTFPNLTCSK